MTHQQVVLVGVDGSAASLYALDWAAQEAKTLGWRLHVVCAYSLPSVTAASLDGGYAALDDTAVAEGGRSILREAVARVESAGIEVTSALETGDPAGVLVDLTHEAGLAVVGTRGRSGFTERLLGTVSSALPAHGRCPVVIVPHRTSKTGEEQPPAFGPVARIVVGVDGSPASEVALARAIDEALAWNAELHAVAGIPPASGATMMAWMPAALDREAILSDVEDGLAVLVDKACRDKEVPAGFRIKHYALDGSGAELLTEFSTAADLIVVGSRGRGGFAGLLLGSVSQAVLHHAVCPVMVVPTRVKDEGLPPTAVAQGLDRA